MIRLVCPYPVSANVYWRSFVNPRTKRSIVTVSKEGEAYKHAVGWIARTKIRERFAGPVAIHIELYPHRPQDWEKRARKDPATWDLDVRCIDLDNARKVLYDALKGILFLDDKLVRRDSGEIMEPDGEGARLICTIEPYTRAPRLPADMGLELVPRLNAVEAQA
jgi:crossover junction endodeoxyribonuclease RusA